jgi:glycosyltransferase involved in cell wall biosynthesis
MRLLCINYEYPPIGGGGAAVCQGLAESLVKKGYYIDVVTSGMNDLPNYEERNGVLIHRVRCIRRYRHYVTLPELCTLIIPLYRKAFELIKKNRYDLNHTHFVVPSGLVSYLLWRKTGLPYLITAHGSDIPGYNPDRFKFAHLLINSIWKRIIKNSIGITTPSNYLKDMIQDLVEVPVTVIPNGYDFVRNGLQGKKDRILLVTRMFERKGVQFFLDAVKNMENHWEIMIAGDGPYLSNLKEKAQSNNKIRLLGFVQGEALKSLYETSKIFVFPSIQENFPVVLLEAMSAGCAVITTTASGCAEVVGEAAIKTEPGDVRSLKAAIHKLLNNNEEIKRLSIKGQARASDFKWNKIADRFDKISNICMAKSKSQSKASESFAT